MLGDLDIERVRDLVLGVIQRRDVPPYSIEFENRRSTDRRPQVYLEGETLHVIASTEPELKRSVGRFVIKHTWTPNDWLLATHPGFYTLTSMALLVTLPAISYLLAYMFPEVRLWTVVLTFAFIIVFSLWTSNQVSRRSARLLRKFTIEMADLECMTEYDLKDYTLDSHLVAIAGVFICMTGALSSLLLGMTFYINEFALLSIPVFVLLPAALCFLYSQISISIDSNLCFETDESEEDEESEVDKFEDNERLQGVFEGVIERMDLRRPLTSWNKKEFSTVRARFSQTRYAQCRGVYIYVEKGTLFVDAEDISEAAAERYGAAALARVSLRFYTELGLKRRGIHIVALLFGLIILLSALAIAYEVSMESGIGVLVFTSVVFVGMWYIGWMQNKEARRDFPGILRKTEMFKEYEVDLYSRIAFPSSSRFDLAFLLGFLVSVIVLGLVILVSA